MRERRKRRINFNYLTMLRGIAILGVVCFHLAPHRVSGGFLGVVIFFVLSGFLMMRKSSLNKEENGKLLDPIKKKIKNLSLPLYVIMIVSLIFALIFFRAVFFDSVKSSLPSALYVQNLYQIILGNSYFQMAGNFSIFTHLWYLSIQIQYILIFYLIIYLLNKYVKKDIKIYVFAALSLVSFGLMYYFAVTKADMSRIYYGTDTRLNSLFLGAVFYILCEKFEEYFKNFKEKINDRNIKITFLVSILLIVIPFFFIRGENYWTYEIFYIVYSVIIGIFVSILYLFEKSLIENRKRIRVNFFQTILFYLGKRSYYIYLWQYMIQMFFAYGLRATVGSKFIYYILQIALVIILSEISYFVFQKKFGSKKLFIAILIAMASVSLASNFMENPKEKELKELEANIEKNKEKADEDNKKAIEEKKKKDKEDKKNKENKSNASSDSKSRSSDEKPIEDDGRIIKKDKYDFDFTQTEKNLLKETSVTAVGDSVILDVNSYLRVYIPNLYLDGEVGRNIVNGPDVLQTIKNNQGLGQIILINLGSNGLYKEEDLTRIMEIADGRSVLFVNTSHTQQWQDYINDQLEKFCDKNENAHLVDWHDYAKSRPELFAKDLVHPNVEGSEVYADIIARAIINVLAK